jgi:hypothetical protein
MNIYEKIAAVRLAFQNANIKPSGKNDFAHYSYYDLADILPLINKLSAENKIFCAVWFTPSMGVMRITDIEKPDDFVEFTTPLAQASLKGCHEVQNLGAAQTYLKRYLYQHAFEIVESDLLNLLHDPNAPPPTLIERADQAIAENAMAINSKIARLMQQLSNNRYEYWKEVCAANRNSPDIMAIICKDIEEEIKNTVVF